MLPSLFSSFVLDHMALSFLASLQFQLIERDTEEGFDAPEWVALCPMDSVERKSLWTVEWEDSVRVALTLIEPQPKPHSKIWNDRRPEFKEEMIRLRDPTNRALVNLILLELAAFDSYWPTKKGQRDYRGLFFTGNVLENFFEALCPQFGFPHSYAGYLRKAIKAVQKEIFSQSRLVENTEFRDWKLGPLSMGIAAPVWQGLFEGAPNSSKDLPVYRGISSMGTGLALNTEFCPQKEKHILAGGGAILAMGMGTHVPRASLLIAESLSVTAAKLEILIREILLKTAKGREILAEILTLQERTIKFLEECISSQKEKNEMTEILAMQQAVTILTVSFSRIRKLD